MFVLRASLTAIFLITAGAALLYLVIDVPAANSAATAQRNVYLYADGTLLANEGAVNRHNVPLAKVPQTVRRAVLAAEDRDFYQEGAVDLSAILRGAYNTVRGNGRQSGSTITQQYVKNYYLSQDQTISRKLKEIFIAVKTDRELNKDEIFERYLNTSYFGRNAYGIEAASQAYYGKDVDKLNTAEGAYLATLLRAPSVYDIDAYPKNRSRAIKRWNYVLDGMVEKAWLSLSQRRTMHFPELKSAQTGAGLSGQRGYIVQAVKQELLSKGILDAQQLAAGGFFITTTIDRTQEERLVQAVSDELISQLRPERKQDQLLRAAAASVDPVSGHTVALYGGVDAARQYINNATRRDYQVGSTFKPFVLAAALANGSLTQDGRLITPSTEYDGTSRRVVQGLPGDSSYAPANEDNENYGIITASAAMEQSVNSVFAQMAADVTPSKVRATAMALGLPAQTLPENPGASIGLGTTQASVLDMAQAYATLDNHGARSPYSLVTGITRSGTAVLLPENIPLQAISRQAADTTTQVLRGVVEDGTGEVAQEVDRPAAGKTGTAEEDAAAWFAGYTPELTTVVAVMGQDPATGAPRPLYGALGKERINGGDIPARIWTQFMRTALAETPAESFDLQL
ncbi:transglycosylase domain-containing protein [Streptomyces sp. 1222.5]|uniref:transglycosylase domain-containing protein n=1 Tax=Streptomyces sp. 1222.5 TaxID=1881026 RepID=UPI003EB95D69